MRYPKIIDELNDNISIIVQLVLTIHNVVEFVKDYDKIKLIYTFVFFEESHDEVYQISS